MRKILLLLTAISCMASISIAQTVPMGMKYQAVARSLSGKILANQDIAIKIYLYSDVDRNIVEYAESHQITTNDIGLFTLVVGEGKDVKGYFDKVPWSTHDIWMEVTIQESETSDFISVSKSKLLTVPYAFHAGTASELVGFSSRGNAQQNGVPANVWTLFGNSGTNENEDVLGTTDCADLIIITNNLERLRISCEGDVNIENNLTVGDNLDVGNDAHIGNDLTVDQDVELNVDGGNTIIRGNLTVDGTTDLNDDLTVNNMAPTLLTGTLTVDKATDLNSTLNVDGTTDLNDDLTVNNMAPTHLSGTLTVDKATDLNSSLNVDGTTDLNDDLTVNNMAPTHLSGTLTVDKATDLNDNLNVDGTTDLNDDVTVNNMAPTYLTGTLEVDKATNLNSSLSVDGATDLNSTLNVDGTSALNNTLNVTAGSSYVANFTNTTNANGITIKVANADPGTGNNFVSFLNSGGTTQGRIEGQTHAELITSFDYIWFQTMEALHTAFATALIVVDLIGVDDADAAIVEGAELATAIAEWLEQGINMELNVGVAFESGSGDYAEWLRKNPNEVFSYGDIVAVKGGMISKDWTDADKYMVISRAPIVLGNMPPAGESHLYEMVAFMGQVPVKVRGEVNIGDYILASDLQDGFGYAVAAKDMGLNDYKKIVGIAWSASEGDKALSMINVAVGINTNDFVGKLQEQQKELNDMKQVMNEVISYLQSKDASFDAGMFALSPAPAQPDIQLNIEQSSMEALAMPHDKRLLSIAQALRENPQFVETVLSDARSILDERGINYRQFEQTNRLLTDNNYFINMLDESLKK